MANMSITGILEKMTGKDKDNSYMAMSDLLSELNKESFRADQDIELKLTNIIMQQLEDASGDVSGLAVKCLAPFAKKVSEDRVVEMTNKLCDKLLNGKDQHRYTASMGLTTIIVELTTPSLAEKILVSLAPQLINGVTSEKSAEIKCECLDILSDVLDRFGNVIAKDHAYMVNALLSQLSSTQASVRKKSVLCIASLAPCLSDDLLRKATLEIVKLLKNRNANSEISRTNIQMIGALSRSVGYRFGPYLAEAVPLLINYCTSASENDEELREYSLQALESFMLKCPGDISPYCEGILNLALKYLSYDPNFTDSMEEDTDDEVQDEEDDDESADEYTDDEDATWKVRRASAKCLSAITVSGLQTLSKMYQEAYPKLVDRFRERDENVKMDIFNTFIELLRQTANVTKGQGDIDESSPRWLLKQEVPKVVKSINRQLREKSIKTKVGAFSVLKELVIVLPDCLADHFGSLVPGIDMALNDKSSTSNLKIEALAFTRIVIASHSPSLFHPYIQALSGPILSAIGDRYYKVTAEALRVCGELVRVLRPNFETRSIDFSPYIGPIYKAILARLANQDQDQEVKECAISCMSLVISTFGDGLQSELPLCLRILVDRMGNEITRLTAVKAFAMIASSPLRIDLKCVLDHAVSELAALLRKANRALRQATLGTLNSLVVPYGGQIGSSSYETIIAELSTLISDIDLHMAALALELCSTIMAMRKPTENIDMKHKVLPQALLLLRSYGLQGQASKELQEFFNSLILCTDITSAELLDSIISSANTSDSGSIAERELITITHCVNELWLVDHDIEGILNSIVNSNNSADKRLVALMCYHEISNKGDSNDHPLEPPIASPLLLSPPVASPTSNLQPYYPCQPEPDQVLRLSDFPEELLSEILVQIPPENPAFLFRAPAVSHAWKRMVTSEEFRESYKKIHRSPPMLGLMHNWMDPEEARYISTSDFRPGRSVHFLWNVCDSRHGFVLLETVHQGYDGLAGYCIWHPLTRQLWPIFVGNSKLLLTKGAVMCSNSDCLHSDCRSTGFSSVFIGQDEERRNIALSYSSDKAWSDVSFLDDALTLTLDTRSPVLIHKTLYFLDKSEHILVYELDSGLSTISRPKFTEYDTLFKTDDNLSLACVKSRSLFCYRREVTANLKWIPFQVVDLLNVLPERCLLNKLAHISVIGYAEGTNNIVLKTVSSILIFDVLTNEVREVQGLSSHGAMITVYPHVGYCLPVDPVGAGKS